MIQKSYGFIWVIRVLADLAGYWATEGFKDLKDTSSDGYRPRNSHVGDKISALHTFRNQFLIGFAILCGSNALLEPIVIWRFDDAWVNGVPTFLVWEVPATIQVMQKQKMSRESKI